MTEYISLSGQAAPALENAPMAFWRNFEWTCHKCLGADACFLDPPHGHRPYTRGPRVGAGIPDERDRNRVSVSKSICHSEFPESTRACACAQGGVGSERAVMTPLLYATRRGFGMQR